MTNLAELMGGEKSGLTITRDIDPGWGFTFKATFDPTSIPADTDGVLLDRETAAVICQVVKEWDLVGPVPFSDIGTLKAGELVKAGKPIPLDPEIVKRIPPQLLLGIARGLVTESFPKSQTRNPENPETLND
jgi:hypothetical protein